MKKDEEEFDNFGLDWLTEEVLAKAYEAYDNKRYAMLEDAVKHHDCKEERFGLAQSGLESRHMAKLIALVNLNPTITCLSLNDNNIENDGIYQLAKGLKYVKKLSLCYTSLGSPKETTAKTVKALAESNIEHLIIGRTVLTNEDADILIANSRQIKINIRSNQDVSDDRIERANEKAKENSAQRLKRTLLGGSIAKRQKKETNNYQDALDKLRCYCHI